MVGTGRQRLKLTALLASGIFALALPSALTLFAEDKPVVQATVLTPATSTSKPATQPVKNKEVKKTEDIARVMEFFRLYQPDVFEKATTLQKKDPAEFERLVQPAIHTVNSLDEMKKNDPDQYKLKIEDYQLTFQAKTLAQQLHRPDITAGERDKVLADITKIVSRQFDIGQQVRQKEIEAIEEKIKKLQAQLDERDKTKDKIISRRMEDLTK